MKAGYAVALGLLGMAATAGAVWGVVRLAARERDVPVRCGHGLVELGIRCCAPGQALAAKHCVGQPRSCPAGMRISRNQSGCVVEPRRIAYPGGHLSLGAEDWEAEGIVAPRKADVAAFQLDAAEVTLERWGHCVVAGGCRSLDEQEPGVPVHGVDPREAEAFCRFEGGRLPTSDEWLWAAMGAEARRYPWGSTGLVCRRATYGIVDGPCAKAAEGPDLAGSRDDGATPEGAVDMAGNVAEWTLEAPGQYVARGGSYRSKTALEVKSWSVELLPPKARTVGFRCAYDVAKPRLATSALPAVPPIEY